MAENSTNGYNSGELASGPSSSIPPIEQTTKHVASESEVSVGDNSESTSVSDHSPNRSSEIPPAVQSHVAPKPTLSALFGMRANYVFQFLGLTATIAFGIWGIKGYIISQEALQQNKIANELTLLNLCISGGTMSAVGQACSGVPLGSALANIASELLPNTQQVTDTVSAAKGSESANLPNIEEDFIHPPELTVTTTVSLPSYEELMIAPPDFTMTIELPVASTPTDTATASVVSSSPLTDSFDLPQSSLSDSIIPSPSIPISIPPETKISHFRTIFPVGGVLPLQHCFGGVGDVVIQHSYMNLQQW